jgi:anti-sigma B factor antagonist
MPPEVAVRFPEDHVVEIAVVGDLDVHTGRLVREALEECLENAAVRTLRLRLAAATFIDSAGLRVLLRARRAAQLTERALVLAEPSVPVLRLLEITGMNKLFTIAG